MIASEPSGIDWAMRWWSAPLLLLRKMRASGTGGSERTLSAIDRLGRPSGMKGLLANALSTVAAALLPLAAVGQGQGDPSQQFVGGQVCQGCHADISGNFRRNPHFVPFVLGNEPPERTGCEGCHGPGFLHAISADAEKIVRFPSLAPSEAQNRCLLCHSDDFGKMHVRRSAHLTGEIGCTSCHSIHGSHDSSPLLAAEQREVCYACHREIRARFDMPFKHRVNEGAIECSDCHNPHGAPVASWRTAHSPRMVSPAFGNDQPCGRCHSDKRGPFVHEHPPVRVEGCQSCHDPHGSTNARLLNRPTVFTMCLECHSEIAGFGSRGDVIPGPSRYFHNLADPVFRDCVLCHSRIHGSNVDRWFRR